MSTSRAHDALVGRTLGEFVVRERIGEGGFGAVYRATQPALDREAVIKVLHARLHTSGAAKERFLREARLASKLDHPYAAHIYAFGAEPDGELWIAMELVRGTPLDQVLRVRGPMPLDRCVQLLDRICEVVHTAHEAGIVHRDLKPANVMVLARAGRVLPKLLDFGIAKGIADGAIATGQTLASDAKPEGKPRRPPTDVGLANTLDTPDDGLTQRGAIIGSPMYMAPEQWMDAGDVTARTDLYALGVVAYECLTGKPPFGGQTISAIAQAHANDTARPLGPGFPVALDAVFAKVLAKAPADRYPDALQFAEAFRRAAEVSIDELPTLPGLDPVLRDAMVNGAPQPIAESIAAFAAARNIHQAQNALAMVVRTIVRYVGLLAVACRSRVSNDDAETPELLRALTRRALTDAEWLELAQRLTGQWVAARDAYPIPELVGLFHGGATDLLALVARDAGSSRDETIESQVTDEVAKLARVLESLAFMRDYTLVVTSARNVAEKWMGVRRPQRTTVAIRGGGLEIGAPALLDKDGGPVLSLTPLFQIAAPTPGAPIDLFLFDGRGRRGAKFVALPSGFEHHDDAVWDWFRAQLSGSLDEGETSIAEEKPPYRGLSAFSAEDGSNFFGREKLVDAFVNRLQIQPLLAVVGRSGAGKSSFVHAGVIPALPAGTRTLIMRPGASPIGALLARLEHTGIQAATRDALAKDRDALGQLLRANAAEHGPILLVIDQLEELFTLCADDEERRIFAEAIAAAARAVEDPVRVVFTLRDDFLIRTEQIAALRNRIGQGLQLLTVPNADDMLRIVVEPARRLGYELEGELAQDMVREVADQPGALALISFTASKLWELRDRHFRRLTQAAYKTLGGVGGALARHAELTLGAMPPEEQGLTREAFRHLVTTQNTRAVLRRGELRQLLGTSAHGDNVIEKLVGARLLVASENESGAETIEIVHEALLVAWPRLVDWRTDDTDGARFREQLRAAAKQWDDRGRDKGLLWRGDALAEYSGWRTRHPGPLTDLEAAFAGASTADAARGRRNLRVAVAIAFTVLGAVVVMLVLLNGRIANERTQANDSAEKLAATLQRQYEDEGRNYVITNQPLEALAYLDKAAEIGVHGPTHDLLVAEAVRATDGEILEVKHENAARYPRFSVDGRLLVTSGLDGVARLWDASSGRQIQQFAHRDTVSRSQLSPDNTLLVTGSLDGTAALWNVATGARLHELTHGKPVWCAQFAPDGSYAVTAGDDGTLAIWDVPDASTPRFRSPVGAAIRSCAISASGALIAAGDAHGEIQLWNSSGALVRTLRGHTKAVRSLQFSQDGARLASASADGTAIVWDPATGVQHQRVVHGGELIGALSSDGRTLVTGSTDKTAIVWDADDGAKQHILVGHAAGVRAVAISPDGTYVVTASDDSTAQLWRLPSGTMVARWRGHTGAIASAQFDPTGDRIATAGDDGRVILWRVRPQEDVIWLRGHAGGVATARFSPDSKRVITTSQDGSARIWDAVTGVQVAALRNGMVPMTDGVYSPDGRSIATSTSSGVVELWDATTLAATALPDGSGAIIELAWSPDGGSLAAASDDGSVICWDVASRRLRFKNRGHESRAVDSLAFSPDGKQLLTVGDDNRKRVWTLDGAPLGLFTEVDGDSPATVAFDSSGTRVLSLLAARPAAKIWDAHTGATLQTFVGHLGSLNSAAWSPDGTMVATSASDGTVRVWDVATGSTLAAYDHGGAFVSFAPDGKSIVVADANHTAAIHALPRYTGSATDLARLIRCRGTFDVQDGQLVPRARDFTACTAH